MRDGHDAEDSRLGSVIARLLSRLGLPSPSASLGHSDMADATVDAFRQLEAHCDAQGVRRALNVEIGLRVCASRDDLVQMIWRLCSMILAARPSGGRIELLARRSAGGPVVTGECWVFHRSRAGSSAEREAWRRWLANLEETFFDLAPELRRLGASLTVNAQEDGCECVLRVPLWESN